MNVQMFLSVLAVIVAPLWLIGWGLADTLWPVASRERRRRRKPSPQFNPDTLEELRTVVQTLQNQVSWNTWPRLTALLITTILRLDYIGNSLANQATLQVERFVSRVLRQVAEDAQTMPARADLLTLLGAYLGALVHAIEDERVSELFRAAAMLTSIANWPDKPHAFSQPLSSSELLPTFKHEFEKLLPGPVDNAAFTGFLQRWRRMSLEANTYLFMLVAMLDAFRRPFFHLCHAGDPGSSILARVRHWTMTYLDGLQREDSLLMYKAFCELMTELQLMTEGETENTYIVHRRMRLQSVAQPTPELKTRKTPRGLWWIGRLRDWWNEVKDPLKPHRKPARPSPLRGLKPQVWSSSH